MLGWDKVYRYLLDGLIIDRQNRVWVADVTYIPMAGGFCYLVDIIDVFSRRLLARRLSNSLDWRFCLAALTEALGRFGGQRSAKGSQFTSHAFISLLKAHSVRISMTVRAVGEIVSSWSTSGGA